MLEGGVVLCLFLFVCGVWELRLGLGLVSGVGMARVVWNCFIPRSL